MSQAFCDVMKGAAEAHEEKKSLEKRQRIKKLFLMVLEFAESSMSWFNPAVWNSGSLSQCNWPIFSPLLSLSEEMMQCSGTILQGFRRLYRRCCVLLDFSSPPFLWHLNSFYLLWRCCVFTGTARATYLAPGGGSS